MNAAAAVATEEIIAWIDELLEAGSFEDYCHNGLQVPGSESVDSIVTAVSANLASIEAAIEAGADLLLVHHGLFWQQAPLRLDAGMARRLGAALAAGLNIAGYHLPLDAHAEIGNNALLRDELGFAPGPVEIGLAKGRAVGVVGQSDDGIAIGELLERIEALVERKPLLLGAGPEEVRSIGIVSGGGAFALAEAIELGLEALLTGEPSEPAAAEAREAGIHLIAAGHHATERLGIARLGELAAERFGLAHRFAEIPNPV